jgi:glutaconate CoA-transferase, subunit B
LMLATIHPGVTFEQVQENTDWPLKRFDSLTETPPPSGKELKALRSIDPEGFWTGRRKRKEA